MARVKAKIRTHLTPLKGSLRTELKGLCYKSGIMKDVLARDIPAYGKVAIAKSPQDKIVGWAVVSRGEGKLGHNPIVMVYVLPNYRGRGLAKILVKLVLKEFRPIYERRTYKSCQYNIPAEKKNVMYFDRILRLFEPLIKNSRFNPKRFYSW